MENYCLFLDESKPNGNSINHLCLEGLIIKQEAYEKEVIKEIKSLKDKIFIQRLFYTRQK